jgi:hypothetical protein
MANKLFFSIEFVGGKATIDELAAVELELAGINKQLAAAKKAGDGDTYKKLRLEQENLKENSKGFTGRACINYQGVSKS